MSFIKGLAGEYAVASELCRRKLNAVITMGNRKSVDIIAEDGEKAYLIQVKTKYGSEWYNMRGVKGDNILVLVDFQGKKEDERADFYVLNSDDWNSLLSKRSERAQEMFDSRGIGVRLSEVIDFKEVWEKAGAK